MGEVGRAFHIARERRSQRKRGVILWDEDLVTLFLRFSLTLACLSGKRRGMSTSHSDRRGVVCSLIDCIGLGYKATDYA